MLYNMVSKLKVSHQSLYWICQLLGWGSVSIYWAYTVYTRDNYGVFYTFLNYVLDIAIGVFLTHLYRKIARKYHWIDLPIKKLVIRVIPSIVILATLYVIFCNLKWYLYWTQIIERQEDLIRSILYWDPILLTGLRLMSIWILAYHLFHYHQKEMNTAKENARLSVLAKQVQLDNLSAQLNPHFLFNSLNSIKSLVLENPNKSRRAIDLLSDLLRSSLYGKDNEFISIEEELILVKDYTEIEKLRFEERLEIQIDLDETLKSFQIPTLSIQLLVENAIKHGIDKLKEGGLVHVSIRKKHNQVEISIQNPGSINAENSDGVGLHNLQERLKIQYGEQAFFSIEMIDINTVEAKISIPRDQHEKL